MQLEASHDIVSLYKIHNIPLEIDFVLNSN